MKKALVILSVVANVVLLALLLGRETDRVIRAGLSCDEHTAHYDIPIYEKSELRPLE